MFTMFCFILRGGRGSRVVLGNLMFAVDPHTCALGQGTELLLVVKLLNEAALKIFGTAADDFNTLFCLFARRPPE